MKKVILLFALLLMMAAGRSYSQGTTETVVVSVFPGVVLDFYDQCVGSVINGYAGQINCQTVGGPITPYYCLDLCTNINYGDTIKDSASTVSYAIYILTNYYPNRTSYPGKLADNNLEAASIQFALWHFRNGYVVDNINISNPTIVIRALEIIAEVDLNGGSTTLVSTFNILAGVNPDEFIVQSLDANGNGIAMGPFQLTISAGTLSTYTVSTGADGKSAPVQVSGTTSGTITATGNAIFPPGFAFAGRTFNVQVLGTASPFAALRTVSADWGLLPVEMRSFTANVTNSTVTLNWNTISETNNSGFDVERKAVNSNDWNKVGFVAGHGTTNTPYDFFYFDRNVASGNYNYRLKQIDYNGNFEYHNLNNEVQVGTPSKFSLSQNYPNPFNPLTKIEFDIPIDAFVSLKVFNTSGKEVATLVNELKTAGYHSVNFNAVNLASGVYYYRLETNGFVKVMKMALVK